MATRRAPGVARRRTRRLRFSPALHSDRRGRSWVERPPVAPGCPGRGGWETPARPYRFVELGRGRVDLPGVIQALSDVAFKGWIVVELDAVPDRARSPKEAAELNRRYLTERLGLTS